MTCECHVLREEMNAGFNKIMGILSDQAETRRGGTHTSDAPHQHASEEDNVELCEENGFSFERLKATKGAIFDYLYAKLITPKLVVEAFTKGYAGCPSIIKMDSKISGYSGTWRFGRERYKKFYNLQIVYNQIIKQPISDHERYALTMHMEFTGKASGAISTLSKKITKSQLG